MDSADQILSRDRQSSSQVPSSLIGHHIHPSIHPTSNLSLTAAGMIGQVSTSLTTSHHSQRTSPPRYQDFNHSTYRSAMENLKFSRLASPSRPPFQHGGFIPQSSSAHHPPGSHYHHNHYHHHQQSLNTGSATGLEGSGCRLIEYRGAQVAAFKVDSRELICLPQAFDLFLKNLVGGLHTVYTKLKRLDISPVVCNVEQVRILRGLGAIQPGVNRCKLISPQEFDVLYEDCTNSSARPGRPPKRSPMSGSEVMDQLKRTKISGFSDYYAQNRLFVEAKKAALQFGSLYNGFQHNGGLANLPNGTNGIPSNISTPAFPNIPPGYFPFLQSSRYNYHHHHPQQQQQHQQTELTQCLPDVSSSGNRKFFDSFKSPLVEASSSSHSPQINSPPSSPHHELPQQPSESPPISGGSTTETDKPPKVSVAPFLRPGGYPFPSHPFGMFSFSSYTAMLDLAMSAAMANYHERLKLNLRGEGEWSAKVGVEEGLKKEINEDQPIDKKQDDLDVGKERIWKERQANDEEFGCSRSPRDQVLRFNSSKEPVTSQDKKKKDECNEDDEDGNRTSEVEKFFGLIEKFEEADDAGSFNSGDEKLDNQNASASNRTTLAIRKCFNMTSEDSETCQPIRNVPECSTNSREGRDDEDEDDEEYEESTEVGRKNNYSINWLLKKKNNLHEYKCGNSSMNRNQDFIGNPHDVTSPCSDLSGDSPHANGENKSKKGGDPEIGERMDGDDEDEEEGGGCGCEGRRQFVPSYPGSILVEEMIKRLVEQQQQLLHLHRDSNFPLETFLANVQGILRLSADNARYMERKFTYEKGILLKKLKHERKTNHKLKQKFHTLVDCRRPCDPMDHHPPDESTFDGPQTIAVPQQANGNMNT